MIIDLNNLNNNQLKKLDEIYNKYQLNIEKTIFRLIKKNKSDTLVLSNLVSRNPEENSLYYKISILKLIEYYNKKTKIKKIILKDTHFQKFLKKNFNKINFELSEKKFFNNNIKKIISNIIFIIKILFLKSKVRKKKFMEKKNIVLIDMFVIKSMISKDNFFNRYYSELVNTVDEKFKKKIFFLPIFFNNSLNMQSIKKIEKNINFILQSDLLNITHYMKIIINLLKLYFFKVRSIKFEKYILDDLINHEIKITSFLHSTLISQLNYYLFKQAKSKKADIIVGIDWFENQTVDKTFNYSFNKFFPKAKLKGYLGINSVLEANNFLIPTNNEKKFHLLPKEFHLINKKNKDFFKRIYKNNQIKISPAYRNQEIFNYIKNNKRFNKKFTILVIFTASRNDVINLINSLNLLSDKLLQKINFIFRFHKNASSSHFIKLIKKNIKFKIESKKKIYENLLNCDCVVCRPGTIYYEAKIFNVPIILTRRLFGILPVNKQKLMNNGFCHDYLEIEKRIRVLIKKRNNIKKINQNSAYNYFSKINYDNRNNLVS